MVKYYYAILIGAVKKEIIKKNDQDLSILQIKNKIICLWKCAYLELRNCYL